MHAKSHDEQSQIRKQPQLRAKKRGSSPGAKHRHDWTHRPQESGHYTTRYQCSTCGRWGGRTWRRRGRVPPIRAFRAGVTEPDPDWSSDDTPRYEDLEATATDTELDREEDAEAGRGFRSPDWRLDRA